jgi:hypothetical protein
MNIGDQLIRTHSQDKQGGQSMMISRDALFHLLQNSRRRAVLRYLIESDNDIASMREVTEQVAAWETDTSITELQSKARQRVYIALYQRHLPKLAEANIIEYNQDRGTLAPTPLLAVFELYLDEQYLTVSVRPPK